MTDFTEEESWHTVEDGEKLYLKTWKPTSKTEARLVFVHGFSDHCNAYGPFFPLLASKGIEVVGIDQRGWGRSAKSPKQRADSGPTTKVLDDIDSVLRRFLPLTPDGTMDAPLFLMGHSMGGAYKYVDAHRLAKRTLTHQHDKISGAEILNLAASDAYTATKRHIRGYLAESPYIALHSSMQPWSITETAGRLIGKLLPKLHIPQSVPPEKLSRDPEAVERLRNDTLCYKMGTLEGMGGMLERGRVLHEGQVRLLDESAGTSEKGRKVEGRVSLFVGHGTGDHVTEWTATKRWVEEDCVVADKTWRVYDGWYHRLHDEEGRCKKIFASEIAQWVLARARASQDATMEPFKELGPDDV